MFFPTSKVKATLTNFRCPASSYQEFKVLQTPTDCLLEPNSTQSFQRHLLTE